MLLECSCIRVLFWEHNSNGASSCAFQTKALVDALFGLGEVFFGNVANRWSRSSLLACRVFENCAADQANEVFDNLFGDAVREFCVCVGKYVSREWHPLRVIAHDR